MSTRWNSRCGLLRDIANSPGWLRVGAFDLACRLLILPCQGPKNKRRLLMLSRRLFATGAAGAPAILAGAARAEDQPAEWTIDRIKRGKVLRIAALPGEAPYFNKDIASGAWSGMCIEMAKDIAGVFEAQVEYLESTYGNSVLDLQANKIDLAFALNPTPKRALVIDFTHAFYLHGFGMVGKKGFHAENWSDLNKPEVKVAVDIGSGHESATRRFAPKAPIIALKGRGDCILGVQA